MSVREEDAVTNIEHQGLTPPTKGIVLHHAFAYDLLVWIRMLGRERAFRERLIDLARLTPGESVLDVGCGTGSLAIAAKNRVGPTGKVYGIDASPEMIARADKKATKAGVEVVFKNAIVEALPFPDAQLDVVLSTLMLHHLSRKAREQCVSEIRRVLKPGGRLLAVDFGSSGQKQSGLFSHLHRRHGHVKLVDMIALINDAGLNTLKSGDVGMTSLNFVLATAP
jgi:ubiquinone/menaquinone biosynthesis C-methylase UbiE